MKPTILLSIFALLLFSSCKKTVADNPCSVNYDHTKVSMYLLTGASNTETVGFRTTQSNFMADSSTRVLFFYNGQSKLMTLPLLNGSSIAYPSSMSLPNSISWVRDDIEKLNTGASGSYKVDSARVYLHYYVMASTGSTSTCTGQSGVDTLFFKF